MRAILPSASKWRQAFALSKAPGHTKPALSVTSIFPKMYRGDAFSTTTASATAPLKHGEHLSYRTAHLRVGPSPAVFPAVAGRSRLLHSSGSSNQDFRPPHFRPGSHGDVRPPGFSWPLILGLGAIVLMLFGGALLVLIVPLLFLVALGSFVAFAARNGRGASIVQSLVSKAGGPAAAGSGGRQMPLLGQWGFSLLARVTSALAAQAEQQARMGRYLHHNLQARVRASSAIRDACGRGVLLGPPTVMSTATASVGVGGLGLPVGSAQTTRIHCEAPIVHDRLGARAMLVVDTTVTPTPPAGAGARSDGSSGSGDVVDVVRSAWGRFTSYANGIIASVSGGSDSGDSEDPREAAYRDQRRKRAEERMGRRERRARAGTGPTGGGPTGLDVQDIHDFIRDMVEDVEDEARFKGDGRPPMAIVVERAELRLPNGRVLDLSDEMAGLFVEDVFTTGGSGARGDGTDEFGGHSASRGGAVRRHEGGAPARGRVIDADWRDAKQRN